MPKFFVEYEARLSGAIGTYGLISEVIEAENGDEARAKFRQKYEPDYDIRFPSQCHTIEFTPTHRYLDIRTNEWKKVEFIRLVSPHNAQVKMSDGTIWEVGRPFLEKL